VFLAGLSNGGRGASVLAPRFRREVAGAILISGLSRRAGPPGMPLLLVHGRADPGVPAGVARRYLRRAGPHATHAVIAGDHFVLLTREGRVRQIIARWLGRQLPGCTLR
jgi:pimeloyl-ACP methyl ester carboxylesterase